MNYKAALSDYRATIALVAANALVYIAIVCGVGSEWFALSGNLAALAAKPWTLLSYMFAQTHVGHLLINLAVLALAGYYYERKTSSARLAAVYLSGGLAGALLFVAICFFANSSVTLIGSSAATLAVWSAIVADKFSPMREMMIFPFGRVKPVWILLIYVVVCFIGLFGSNPGGNMAHIGGIIAGVVAGRIRSVVVVPKRKDKLIEKVEQSGFASLTNDERRLLFEKYRKSHKCK